MKPETAAKLLTVSGVIVGIGGYLSQPENLAVLSPKLAHYVAAAGAVLYVVGQGLTHFLTGQKVDANTKALASSSTSNPVAKS